MNANDRSQLEIGRALGHKANSFVQHVIFAEGKYKRALPLKDLELWIAALGNTTIEQRNRLRDLAYKDYGTDQDRKVRAALKSNLSILLKMRESLELHDQEVPENITEAIQNIEGLLGE